MNIFRGQNHEFELTLSINALTRIKAHLRLDLLKPETPDASGQIPLLRLYGEPELLIQCAGLILHSQLKEKFSPQLAAGLADEITGQPLTLLDFLALECTEGRFEQLREAFFEEIRDFFRRIGLPEKAALCAKQGEMISQSKGAIAEQMSALNLDKAVDQIRSQDLQSQVDQALALGPMAHLSIPGSSSSRSQEC